MNSFAQRTVTADLADALTVDSASGNHRDPVQSRSGLGARKHDVTTRMVQLTFCATVAMSLEKGLSAPGLDSASILALAAIYVALGLVHWAARRGHQRLAARLLCYPALFSFAMSLYCAGGLNSEASVFVVPLLLFSAIALGQKDLTLCLALGLGVGAAIATLDHLALLPDALPRSSSATWLQLLTATGMSMTMLYHLSGTLQRAQADVEEAGQRQRDAQHRYFTAQKLALIARVATGVAHDFNNLLGVIVNVTASLRIETRRHPSVQELLDDLDAATARASLMTSQLLALNRPRELELEVIDIEEFVQSLAPLLARLLGDEIEVRCLGTVGDLAIEADRGQLEQVMLNLAVNARDAMPRGGLLTIRIGSLDSERIAVSVEDTGEGIADEIKSEIFSAFFTTKETGSGLGLATVADIVERLHGSIQVQSRVGRGSSFTITLPATRMKAKQGLRSLSRLRLRGHGARVLLAEDHELMRRATHRILEQAGYSVTSVASGHDALARVQTGAHFDILLTDISMPLLSGIDLAERLYEQGQALPTVFISGAAAPHASRLEDLAFETRYLAKPFAQQDLIDAIEDCLCAESCRDRAAR